MSKQTTLTIARTTGLLFVGAALALTAGCGGGGKLESSSAFQYLPSDSAVIGSFRVDEIMKSQAYKDLMADQKVKSTDPLKKIEKEVGLTAEDLERVVVAASGKGADVVMVVTTKKPVTAADLTGKMANRKFKEVKVGSFTLHEGDDAEAFCVADKNTIIYSKAPILKGILERNKKAELTAGMKQALDLADQSKPIFVAINAKGLMAGDAKDILPPPAAAHADKIEAVALNAALGGDAQLNLVALCQDSAAAEAIHKEADSNLKKAKEALGELSKAPGMASLSGEIGKVIDTVKITASGNKVSGTVSVKPVTIFTTIDTFGHTTKDTFESVKPIIEDKK